VHAVVFDFVRGRGQPPTGAPCGSPGTGGRSWSAVCLLRDGRPCPISVRAGWCRSPAPRSQPPSRRRMTALRYPWCHPVASAPRFPHGCTGLAESPLQVCPQLCDRMSKLGPVRGQCAALGALLSRLASDACKPTLLMSPVPGGPTPGLHTQSNPALPRVGFSLFGHRQWCHGPDAIRGLVRLP